MYDAAEPVTPGANMMTVETQAQPSELLTIASRDQLLHELQLMRKKPHKLGEAFLVVINVADTKSYDDIVRIFGYNFVDKILSIRLRDLEAVCERMTLYQVGFWSAGLIFVAGPGKSAEDFFDALAACLLKPIICRGISMPIKAGIGVCDIKQGLGTIEDLLQAAFNGGRSSHSSARGWSTCNYEVVDDHHRAFSLIADIGYALTLSNELELSYLPRINLKTGYCESAEALLRWRHPHFGVIMPDELIPIVEMIGLTSELTDWVLTQAIAEAVNWHKQGIYLKISVNILPKNVEQGGFVEHVVAILDRFGLPPSYLELELSENRYFHDLALAQARLQELRELGVNITLDDFGTGDNSLVFLRAIPADTMKIDPSLINAAMSNERDQTLLKSILSLAQSLGIKSVAEGVEKQETLRSLYAWGCNHAQGYLFGRPMHAREFNEWCGRNLVTVV